MKEAEKERNWDFSDRIFQEKFDKNQLSQILYKA